MTRKTTNDLTSMGRRRFLRSLANLGVSGIGLSYMTKDSLAKLTSNPENEVPRLGYFVHTNHKSVVSDGVPPNREPVYYTISRDKWIVVESAHDGRKQIENRIASLSIDPIISVQTTTIGQHRQKEIVVHYTVTETRSGDLLKPEISFEDFADQLPATVDGVAGRGIDAERTVENIPVRPQHDRQKQQAHYEYEYRPVPAGCIELDENGYYCTIGTPVYDKVSNQNALVGAGHCLNDSSEYNVYQNDSISQDLVGHPDSDRVVANTDSESGTNFDAGVINLKSGTSIECDFASDSGSGYAGIDIVGIVSESRLRDYEGNQSLKKRGSNTGLDSGTVVAVSNSQFQTDTKNGPGDSGGPHYDLEVDAQNRVRAYIAGVHGGKYTNTGYSYATQMENIESRFNLYI